MKKIEDIPITTAKTIDAELLKLCKSIEAKRARTVIDHILQHGFITTEELSQKYGYEHPPRAARDVRENGVPLITHKVQSPNTGRLMGVYTFDSLDKIKHGRIGGRKAFSKKFKDGLLDKYGNKDAFSQEKLHSRYLQIDHRIPYEIAGNVKHNESLDDFMLIDASSQRAKSWSCENCKNFNEMKDQSVCQKCFWAFPESYEHVAMKPERRAQLVWQDNEVNDFENLMELATQNKQDFNAFIKEVLKNFAKQK